MIVPISQIEAGAVAALPITGANGQMLLPAGAVLSAGALQSLENRGVEAIDISIPEDPEKRRQDAEKEKERLNGLFADSPQTPELAMLQQALLEAADG